MGRGARALLALSIVVGASAGSAAEPKSFVTFESGQVRPLAMSPDGTKLFAVNTPDNRLEVFDIGEIGLNASGSVEVGLEPVAVAVRSSSEVWVVNHLSDSVSIVDVSAHPPRVVRTLLVGDEPRDIIFAGVGKARAFITTAHRGQRRSDPALMGVPGAGDPQLTTPGIGRADVWVFDADQLGTAMGGIPISLITLFGDTPRALASSPDGRTVYAAIFHSGNRTTTVSEGAVCRGGSNAGPCRASGLQLPGGVPGPDANIEGITHPRTGLIVRFNDTTGKWEDELARDWSNAVRFSLPDKDVFVLDALATPPVETGSYSGVGTVLFNMAVHPLTGAVYVSNTEALNEVRFEGAGTLSGSTVRGHQHETRISVLADGMVRPRHLNKHIDYTNASPADDVRQRSLALPMGMAITSDGSMLCVAAFGSSRIGVFSTAEIDADLFEPSLESGIPVSGGGPSGLVLDEKNQRMYVLTRFDNGISTIDFPTRREVSHVKLFNPEPSRVVEGRRFLYDASFTSQNGEAACASCHVFGDLDSLAWDLGDPDANVIPNPNPIRANDPFGQAQAAFHPMKGPMVTQSLRGMATHGPMHWRGDRTGGSEVGGDSLSEEAAFKTFNPAFKSLLGRDSELTDEDMQAFTDFILEVTYPPNPNRALDNSLSPDQAAGRQFFFGPISDGFFNCNGCHVTDRTAGQFGTAGLTSFVIESEIRLQKIPHLRNLYQKVGMFGMLPGGLIEGSDVSFRGEQIRGFGFLHDGSFDTLLRFLQRPFFLVSGFNHGGFRNDAERRAVEQFLLAFDSDLAPIVGQQVTLTSATEGGVDERIRLLVDRAALGECDLTVRGVCGGESCGWLMDFAERFESDSSIEPPSGLDELRDVARLNGTELTFTCVPPGSGVRVALDRDEDGFFDRLEIRAGTDPADASSHPRVPDPTATATPIPTVTPSPVCAGDCDNDGRVTIGDLVKAVGLALESNPIATCPSIDANGDDKVSIDELVRAVQSSFDGCPVR